MKQVIQHYGPTLNFYCHAFPLPYHRNAFLVAQAGLIVEKEKDEDAWFEWLELMFANQNQFGTMETNNVTGDDVVQQLAKYASSFGIDTTFFMNGMKYGSEFDSDARIEWKYATTRGVYGTPIYFVNGVFLPDASSWSFARWKKLIDSLLETKLH
jgi:2-hydroxychromene-2-carboxylate isomerase